MHQNSPFSDKNLKKNSGKGAQPHPQTSPSPSGEGTPSPPHTLQLLQGLRPLDPLRGALSLDHTGGLPIPQLPYSCIQWQ